MRINKQTISDKSRLGLAVCEICLVAGSLFLLTQNIHAQTVVDEKHQIEVANQLKEQRKMFWKVSSTEKPADEGNRIIAVRRIKLHFQDVDTKGFEYENHKDLIEIEVFSVLNIPIGNAMDFLVVGDMAFASLGMSADGHTVFVHPTPEEFNKIKDGSIVSFVISNGVLNDEYLKSTYKMGEPKEIPGAKFGRLNKSLIDRFPVIEEDRTKQIVRMAQTKNEVQ